MVLGFKVSRLAVVVLSIVGLTTTVTACSDASRNEEEANQATTLAIDGEKIVALADEAQVILLKYRPELATLNGMDTSVKGFEYSRHLSQYDPVNEKAFRSQVSAIRSKLLEMPVNDDVNLQHRIAVLEASLSYFEGLPSNFGYINSRLGPSPYIVNQLNGPLIEAPLIMQTSQRIHNETDAKHYIERLAAFESMVESILWKLDIDAESGWIPPKVIVESSIAYLEAFTSVRPEQHRLITSFISKMQNVESLTERQKNEFAQSAIEHLSMRVYPAFERVRTALNNLQQFASRKAGLWALPGGKDYYRASVNLYSGGEYLPEHIHEIGLQQIEKVQDELNLELARLGYTEGSVSERLASLSLEGRFAYTNDAKGEAEVVEDIRRYISEIDDDMRSVFGAGDNYHFDIMAIPDSIEWQAPVGRYSAPSLNGNENGTFWLNTSKLNALPKFAVKTLTYHESLPGHHLQVSKAYASDASLIRKVSMFNAYSEGWALYAENLAYELGVYDNDPYGNIGRLKSKLFHTAQLVVDTGIHAMEWDRDRAVDYLFQNTGLPFDTVEAEVLRTMVRPGRALGYKLGMLKLLELRGMMSKYAEKTYLRDFHDLVLNDGAMPFTDLKKRVDIWVNNKIALEGIK